MQRPAFTTRYVRDVFVRMHYDACGAHEPSPFSDELQQLLDLKPLNLTPH